MKFREIKRRIRTESAFLNPVLLGICAGSAVLLGALFATNLVSRPIGILLPRTPIPSFLFILFQLTAYALFGAAFAALLSAPMCQEPRYFQWQKKGALLLFLCTLVLSYVWVPLVCRAGSYFLGVLLCGVILTALFVLIMMTYRFSLIASVLLVFFCVWTLYILYLTLSFLLFC